MIKEIHIQNYKSIVNAKIKLSPFTLLIGANGAGKSNFLNFIENTSLYIRSRYNDELFDNTKHFNHVNLEQQFSLIDHQGYVFDIDLDDKSSPIAFNKFKNKMQTLNLNAAIFSLTPQTASQKEKLIRNSIIEASGKGVVQVLDSLKTGDREDLFHCIEERLKKFIPEIEKLSFISESGSKRLQVRERHINKPVPVSQLSEGTQLTLIILTILFQENPPSLICIEDIDSGLHPRLYGQIIDLCFELSQQENIQIIATTHNPYLVDHFKDHEEAVIIVEKKNAETTFTSLADRLNEDNEDQPLGELWYTELVGGVPKI